MRIEGPDEGPWNNRGPVKKQMSKLGVFQARQQPNLKRRKPRS